MNAGFLIHVEKFVQLCDQMVIMNGIEVKAKARFSKEITYDPFTFLHFWVGRPIHVDVLLREDFFGCFMMSLEKTNELLLLK